MKTLSYFKTMAKDSIEYQKTLKEKHKDSEIERLAYALFSICGALEVCQKQRNQEMQDQYRSPSLIAKIDEYNFALENELTRIYYE